MKKHYIYALKNGEDIFYIGYSRHYPDYRFEQHKEEAIEPTGATLYERTIRGEPTAKHAQIIDAVENNRFSYEIIVEKYRNEDIDEEHYIQHYKSLGYKLTNIAQGQVWNESTQPYKPKVIEEEYTNECAEPVSKFEQIMQNLKANRPNIVRKTKTNYDELFG